MNRDRMKKVLDCVPLVLLLAFEVVLIWTVTTTNDILSWRNITGLILVSTTCLAFGWRHKIGVMALGLTLFLGLFGIFSYTPALVATTFGFRVGDAAIELWLQPVFLLWIAIHLVLSGRHYVGILSRQYWRDITSQSFHSGISQKKP